MNKHFVIYKKNNNYYKAVLTEDAYNSLLSQADISEVQCMQNEQMLDMIYESKINNVSNQRKILYG